jgi:hypothetical protein
VSSRAAALDTSGPTSGAAGPTGGGDRRGGGRGSWRRGGGGCVLGSAGGAAVVVVVVSAGAEVEHGGAGEADTDRRLGSERRRTTDWRSVTCSMRPTRPPEVMTGMPTATSLRLPWLMVIVWSKFDGGLR